MFYLGPTKRSKFYRNQRVFGEEMIEVLAKAGFIVIQ